MQEQERKNKMDPSLEKDELSEVENAGLLSEKTQEEYRKAYLEQLRKRQCPGCGETDIF